MGSAFINCHPAPTAGVGGRESSRQLVTAEEDGQETPEESRVRFALFVSPSLSAISASTRLIRRPGRLFSQGIILVIGLKCRDCAGAGKGGRA